MPPRPKAASAKTRSQRPARESTRSPLRQVQKEALTETRSRVASSQKTRSAPTNAEAVQSRRSPGSIVPQSRPRSNLSGEMGKQGVATTRSSSLRKLRNVIEAASAFRRAGGPVASMSESSEIQASPSKNVESARARSRSGSVVRSRSGSLGTPTVGFTRSVAGSFEIPVGDTKRARSGSIASTKRGESRSRSGSIAERRSDIDKVPRSRSSSNSPQRKLGGGPLGSSFTSTTGSDAIRRALQSTHYVADEESLNKPRLLHESSQVKLIDKSVNLPQFRCEDRIEEIPVLLYEDRVVIIPERQTVEVTRQVPKVEIQDRIKKVALPLYEGRDKVVEVTATLKKEELVEVPTRQCIEALTETARPVVQMIRKHVEVNVNSFVDKIVEVPQITTKELIVEVPQVVETVELKKEVLKVDVERVAKKVVKPEFLVEECTKDVPMVEKVERVVEVPKIEYHTIVKEVPVYVTEVVEKKVPIPEIRIVERCVEIPTIQKIERIIEVPEVEIREVIRKVPRPIVQYVDKQVIKAVMNYTSKLVEIPCSLVQEVPVEIPESMVVESVVKIPKPVIELKDKEFSCVTYEVNEKVVEVPLALHAETPVEVDIVQTVEQVRQVMKPEVQYIDKVVPSQVTECIEKVEEVRIPLQEEKAVFTPQLHLVERVQEQAVVTVENQLKAIPKFAMQYLDRVVEKETQMDSLEFCPNVATRLTACTTQGQVILPVDSVIGFQVGQEIVIDRGTSVEECHEIAGIFGAIALNRPLQFDHAKDAVVLSRIGEVKFRFTNQPSEPASPNQSTNPPPKPFSQTNQLSSSQLSATLASVPASPTLGSRSRLRQYPQMLPCHPAVSSQPESSRTLTPRSPTRLTRCSAGYGVVEASMQSSSSLLGTTMVPSPIGSSSLGLTVQRAPSPMPLTPSSHLSRGAGRAGPSRSQSPQRLRMQSDFMMQSVSSLSPWQLRSGAPVNRYALQAVGA